MAGKAYSKNIRRTIRGSFGRYLAIMAIVALGVGFLPESRTLRHRC
ncbi:MAG: hypothetical protein V8Q42_04990 [Anaerovoracaceae bacterium]